ncbi:MAG: mechanosensitive ion channel [Rickettsiales bacterium]
MDFLNNKDINTEQLTAYIAEYGLKILLALAIFIIGKWVAKRIVNIVKKSMGRASVDEMLVSFIGNIAYALIMAFVIIAAISELGIETTSIAAIFAAAGLAIGLALQGSLSNFAAGVMVVIFRPFRTGDFVELAGTSGVVKDINIFTTTLKTGDNKTIIIPNSAATSGSITNYSTEENRRIDLVFGCGYNDDLKKVRKVLESVVESNSKVLKDPAVTIAVSELGASSVDFIVRPWVKTADYWAARFEIVEAVKEAFDKEGISIPYPQQDVHMHQAKS